MLNATLFASLAIATVFTHLLVAGRGGRGEGQINDAQRAREKSACILLPPRSTRYSRLHPLSTPCQARPLGDVVAPDTGGVAG